MDQKQPNFKPVYIFGAGASKAIGAPLVNDFISRTKELMYDPKFSKIMQSDFMTEKLLKHFELVFKYQKQLFETRQFLSLLERR